MLAFIIDDYLPKEEPLSIEQPISITPSNSNSAWGSNNSEEKPEPLPMCPITKSPLPEYVRELFRFYCHKQQNPNVKELGKIYNNMTPDLRQHFFDEYEDALQLGAEPVVSLEAVRKLFPNVKMKDKKVEVRGSIPALLKGLSALGSISIMKTSESE